MAIGQDIDFEPLLDMPGEEVVQDTSLQILEIRAGEDEQPVTITAAIAAGAVQVICIALAEQRDRDARAPTELAAQRNDGEHYQPPELRERLG
jgi:hypothetical protein